MKTTTKQIFVVLALSTVVTLSGCAWLGEPYYPPGYVPTVGAVPTSGTLIVIRRE